MRKCVLCDTELIGEAQSREHVIPESLGGRKRTSMALCRQCNSTTGHEWDAELERQLRGFSLIVFPPTIHAATSSAGSRIAKGTVCS